MRLLLLFFACWAASAGALRADAPALGDSLYVRLGLGGSLLPAGVVSNAEDGPLFTGRPGTEGDWSGDWALGWQDRGHWGAELGFTSTQDGPISGLATDTTYVMPTWRLAENGFFGEPCLHTFGLRFGASNLDSPQEWDGPFGDFTDDWGGSTAISVCYRFEQMLGGFVSLGLDFTYTWASYPVVEHGSQTNLDDAGPGLKLSLAFWPLRPFAAPGASYGVDAAAFWLRKGDALMAGRHYDRAASAYWTALEKDPKNRWAWQGLGNAFYCMGQAADALGAYERADALAGGDKKLELLEGKLRAALGGQGRAPGKAAVP